jgi:uncharacterized protein (DUF302 family)
LKASLDSGTLVGAVSGVLLAKATKSYLLGLKQEGIEEKLTQKAVKVFCIVSHSRNLRKKTRKELFLL